MDDIQDDDVSELQELQSSVQEEKLSKGANLDFFNQGSTNTKIPVDITFEKESHSFFEEKPSNNMPLPSIETPGKIATFAGRFGQQNEINQLAEFSDRSDKDNSPIDDYVDPNWSYKDDPSASIGIDPRSMNYLSAATGPKDLRRRSNYIKDKQEQDDKLSRGNLFYQLAGGFAGMAASPSSILIMGKSAKYAKMSQEFLQEVPKAIGGLSLSSAAHEAVMETTKTGGNLEDWAIDTFADTVMATAFVGVGVAGKHLLEAQKLYNAKGLITLLNKDIEARPQVNEKGELVSWKATPMNSSVGAAEVDMAQVYLDGSMAKNSLYSIPYIGDKIGYAAGEAGSYLAGKVSPIIRNMNSHFPVMRGLVNNLADHGIDTVGTEALRPNPDSFSSMMDVIRGTNTNYFHQYNGLYMRRNGIEYNDRIPLSESKAKLQTKLQEKLSADHVTREQFGREVQYAIINKTSSDNAAVNEAVEMINSAKDPLYKEWLTSNGYSDKILPPRTAEAHFMRVYHAAYMDTIEGETKWMSAVPEKLAKDDAEITSLMEPINNLKSQMAATKDEKIATDLSFRIKQLENDLQDQIRSNNKLHRHLEDIHAVSATEADQINSLMKPIKDLEAELKLAKKKEEKAVIREKLDKANYELREKMLFKKIDEALIENPNGTWNDIKLKDPANRLKLRDVYKSDKERMEAAKGYYESILNQTSEDNIRNIMGRMTNNPKENPLGKRTLMLDDNFLYDNNFLHPDPIISLMNYRQTLGRKIATQKVLRRLTTDGTYEGLIETLAKQFKEMKESATTEKQRAKIGKRYRAAKKDLELFIGKMEGRSNYSQTAREYSTLANLWAVITKLGFLPGTMSTDLMSNVFKHEFWPSVRDGLLPMLKSLNGLLNTKDGEAVRQEAAHAHVAMQDVNMSYSDKNWTGTTQTYEPIKGKLTTGFETLAHYSMNWTGANYVENFMHRMTAQIIQSKIIKAMLDFQAGKISEKDHKSLLRYGLDPKEWSERIIDQWKAAGSDGNGFGGYRSNYWKWQDLEASNRVATTIMRGVRDTIIRRGMFDAPFAMDNPVFNSLFLFKGYTLTSINRFLVPMLQKPDAQKIVGTMLMMTAGATQNPLRRLANGQDPTQEDDHMFRNALRDGGVFSSVMDAYEDANFMVNGLFQETVTNERYRNRLEMGVFNGPIGGMAGDLTRIIGMVGRGEWNQQDVRRIAANTPFIYSWQLRGLANKMIEGSGLPKNREQAHKLKSIQ